MGGELSEVEKEIEKTNGVISGIEDELQSTRNLGLGGKFLQLLRGGVQRKIHRLEGFLAEEQKKKQKQTEESSNKRGILTKLAAPERQSGKASSDMIEALGKQDKKAEEMRKLRGLYEKLGLDYPEDGSAIPIELLTVAEKSSKGNERKEETILKITEVMRRYADGLSQTDETIKKPDPNLLKKAILLGTNIHNFSDGAVFDLMREKIQRASTSDKTYYVIGAAQLREFFRTEGRDVKLGRDMIPYIIAYAAGVMAGDVAWDVDQHLRNWLMDIIPLADRQVLGFGSMLQPLRQNSSLPASSEVGASLNNAQKDGLDHRVKQAENIISGLVNDFESSGLYSYNLKNHHFGPSEDNFFMFTRKNK